MGMFFIILLIFAYFVGAIPTGYWFCRYIFNIDPMQFGSGNIGATNVARILGNIKYFFLIFFVDAAKAFLTLLLADVILSQKYAVVEVQNCLLLLSITLLLGNSYSVFIHLKGGKGVATTIGIVAYIIPSPLVFIFALSWIVILLYTKQVFLASLGSAFVLTFSYWLLFYSPGNLLAYFLLFVCYWLVVRHRNNIQKFFNLRRW